MGLFKRKEKIDVEIASDTLLAEILNTGEIGKAEALNIPAVAACVDFISNKIAELPIKLYKENGESTAEIKSDERIALLNDETGDMLTPYDMKKALVQDYLLEGVGYIYPERKGNSVIALRYIEKNKVSAEISPNPIYKSAVFRVNGYKFYDWQLLRLCRNTQNGAKGLGIIRQAQEMLTITYKSLLFEKYLMQNGGNKKGFLKSARKLEKAAVEDLKAAWQKLYSNNGNNMMVLNDGIDFKESSNTSVEMQLNEQKQTNNEYICQLFNLSPDVVAGRASEDVYTSAIKTAVMPVILALQGALNQSLLLESERKEYYFVVDTTELLKGDILKRYQAYQIGLANNFLQPDEVRYKEDLKPLGFNFIKLGLQDVLLDPKTNTVYTPNTNKTTKFGTSIEETRDNNFIQDKETGQMQGSRPHGGSSKSDSGKSEKKSDKKDSEGVEKSAESDIIKSSIKSKAIKLEINREKQARHIKGTREYIEGRSYLTISETEAQAIIDKKHGTGELILNKNGIPAKERIDAGKIIGVDIDINTGEETITDKATIHYSKTGTHLVPRKETKQND